MNPPCTFFDRCELATQIGVALIQSQATWPQTREDTEMWATTAVQLADALLQELAETEDQDAPAPAAVVGAKP